MLITSFSPAGYAQYGRRFLETYQETRQQIPLLIYYEPEQPEKPDIPGVEWMPIVEVQNFKETEGYLASNPIFCGQVKTPEGEEIYSFRTDAHKFFRKVFAINDAYRNASRSTEFLAWIDADVEFTARIPVTLPRLIFPRNEVVAYIGRANQHSECGFMGFNLKEEGPLRRFMMVYWSMYATGAFTHCREWHDSYLFDHAMALASISAYSLSGDQCLNTHPWSTTLLGDWTVHHKGPKRKETAYGEAA